MVSIFFVWFNFAKKLISGKKLFVKKKKSKTLLLLTPFSNKILKNSLSKIASWFVIYFQSKSLKGVCFLHLLLTSPDISNTPDTPLGVLGVSGMFG